MSLRSLVGMLLVSTLAACGGTQDNPQRFQRDVTDFHNHLRWGRFDQAEAYMNESTRAEFEGELQQLGAGYQVTEFELRSVTMYDDGKSAQVVVWMQSYRLPSTSVSEETVAETWEYNKELGSWELTKREHR